MRRLALALLVLAVVPVFYCRQPFPPPSHDRRVTYHDLLPGLIRDGFDTRLGALDLVGAWQLTSPAEEIGNFSGLAQWGTTKGPGRMGRDLVAVSDRNAVMVFSRPDQPGPAAAPWHTWLHESIHPATPALISMIDTDSESISVEPGSGAMLIGYEGAPRFHLFSADMRHDRPIAAPVLKEWPENKGPESLRHLADGRTVAIGEVYSGWFSRRRHPGFIWPGLPRDNEAPARFELVMPEGYRPVELAQMPDGRLLILGRKFTLDGFRTVVTMVDDPRVIRSGASVVARPIAWLTDSRLRDNYEGMVATAEPDGGTAVWLISDNNQMAWLQRTLLLKLRFER